MLSGGCFVKNEINVKLDITALEDLTLGKPLVFDVPNLSARIIISVNGSIREEIALAVLQLLPTDPQVH